MNWLGTNVPFKNHLFHYNTPRMAFQALSPTLGFVFFHITSEFM